MHHKSLLELNQLLTQKKISSLELTTYFLDRATRHNDRLNAFITLTPEIALQQAASADAQIAQGDITPLTGIPIAHKDIFCTQDIPTTCGSRMLLNFCPPYNATIVENCKRAGAVLLGKTNMDEFGMGSSTENSYFGATQNPWDPLAIPGGSSGGAAVAVAGGLSPLTTASDTGGSIRQPASHCGVCGLKPTYGRVSRWGMVSYASSLDQAGPMAKSAEDMAVLLATMAGFDHRDATSAHETVPNYFAHLKNSIRGLRIGLPDVFFSEDLEPQVRKIIDAALKELESLGCILKPICLPHAELSIAAYYIIAPSEASSNLARYDGVRFGYRCKTPKDIEDLYTRSRTEGFGEEVKRRILVGTYALSAGYFDAYYLKAQKIRRLIQQDFLEAFREVDILAAPNAATPAFDLQAKTDPVSMYLTDLYTIATNLAGLPGMSIPAGFVQKRPVGLQLTGPFFSEALLLTVGHQFQRITDWHKKMAPDFCQ